VSQRIVSPADSVSPGQYPLADSVPFNYFAADSVPHAKVKNKGSSLRIIYLYKKLYTRFCKQTIEQEFNYIKITVFHNKIAQNHVVAHFKHETIAKQFDHKNVWIFSFPLAVNLSWERLELAILEASDQMISQCDVVLTVCFVWYAHFLTLTHTQRQHRKVRS
jgi:hypothetical protein